MTTNDRAYGREDKRRRRAAWRDAGLCATCGRQPERPERVTCDRCIAAISARQTVRYYARKAERRCGQCGDPLPEGSRRFQCAACCERQNTAARAERTVLRARRDAYRARSGWRGSVAQFKALMAAGAM